MVSTRAKALAQSEPFLVKAHFECAVDEYSLSNPNGFINLGTAENHLLWDILQPMFNQVQVTEEKTIHYDQLYGSRKLRTGIATYLERVSEERSIDPDCLVVAAGGSAVIEMLIYALCEPGDGILIPAPYYSGFDFDMGARCAAVPIPITLHSDDRFSLTIADVQKAYLQSKEHGMRPKVLLITSPNNPVGSIYSRELIAELITFCESEKIDCIFDEVYAHSCFGSPGFSSSLAFTSNHVHTVYSFAKDIALSGLKTGVAHSTNSQVLSALHSLSYFSPVSTHTQNLLAELLNNEAGLTEVLFANRRRLRESYEFLTAQLAKYKIEYMKSQAGLFLLLDLRAYLDSKTFDAEHTVWEKLFYQGKVSTSPGSVFHIEEPGFFRICFARPKEILEEGVARMARILNASKSVTPREAVPKPEIELKMGIDPICGDQFFYFEYPENYRR